jgi:hypothetical protein
MAQLEINNYTLTPLNPDGTPNTNLPELSGTLPPTESVDFASMGQRFQLVLECEMSGTYSDSSTADVAATFVRYNPAMFVDPFSKYPFAASFPAAGYLLQIPNTTVGIFPMPLSFVNGGQFVSCNENGSVSLEVTSGTEFTITHSFRITNDIEGYVISQNIDNQKRLTRNSINNAEEFQIDRPTVFGTQKAINALVATRQRNFTLVADELSVNFRASFDGYDQNGDAVFPMTVTYERESLPVSGISTFADTIVTISFEDPSAVITDDELCVLLTERKLLSNVAGYEKDLDLKEVKLVSTGSTATISGPFKGPVIYDHSAGVTSVSFVLDHTELELSIDYDLHAVFQYATGPSDQSTIHNVVKTTTIDFDTLAVDFDMSAEFYSRNGNHAESFTATVMERIVNVLTIDRADYNALASLPFTTFEYDAVYVRFALRDSNGTELYTGDCIKNTTTLVFNTNDKIQVVEDGGTIRFVAKAFRIPYENFQNLPNLGTEAINEYTFRWEIFFTAQADDRYNYNFYYDNALTVRQYENAIESPSDSPKVSNIRFLDPSSGLPIGNWCDLQRVQVLADVEELTDETYVQVFVDKFPLGSDFNNDFALEEQDAVGHTLPAYVVIEELSTDLVSNLTAQPVSNTVSFLLDVSNLSNELDKYRISIMTYNLQP